ncbi:hypothetical protein Glove_198g105 [Diversispora epigaea]|uniref:Uncharacterized protein n=1 Tax=Diversispora epigaea TaxID=1348612 RepID=A0A397IKH6_9GLOM|nr:hypothetical protein Glove_198g105 [Diversispora epigaea]
MSETFSSLFDSDLSSSVYGPLRESSEECAIQLHHYTPQNEIDKEMFCLFTNKKSNPKELFEALQEIIKNRKNLNNNKNNSNVVSADEVYELLSQEVSRLQELYKMVEFEKKGIRPTSLFQSSFRLLEEENEENLVGPI